MGPHHLPRRRSGLLAELRVEHVETWPQRATKVRAVKDIGPLRGAGGRGGGDRLDPIQDHRRPRVAFPRGVGAPDTFPA